MSNLIIGPAMPMPPFFPQAEVMGQLGITVSTLNVTSLDVKEGTCFQCEIAISSGVFRSKQGCVTAVGECYMFGPRHQYARYVADRRIMIDSKFE